MAAKRKKAQKKLASIEKTARKRSTPPKAKASGRRWASPREVDREDVRRVIEHGVDDADQLAASAHSWLVRLAQRIRLLYDMLVAWWMGRFEFPKSTVAAITLALLYFINPFDLIPDVLPVVGVVDEAMVFAFVTSMMSDDIKRYTKKFGLRPVDVGA